MLISPSIFVDFWTNRKVKNSYICESQLQKYGYFYFQVALGSSKLCELDNKPESQSAGYDSTQAVGRQTPDNTYDVTLPSGKYR